MSVLLHLLVSCSVHLVCRWMSWNRSRTGEHDLIHNITTIGQNFLGKCVSWTHFPVDRFSYDTILSWPLHSLVRKIGVSLLIPFHLTVVEIPAQSGSCSSRDFIMCLTTWCDRWDPWKRTLLSDCDIPCVQEEWKIVHRSVEKSWGIHFYYQGQ